MDASFAGAEAASDPSTMARPTQRYESGRAVLFASRASQVRRNSFLQNFEVGWLGRLHVPDRPLSHYAIFMPLKNESNRHVQFQTFRPDADRPVHQQLPAPG